MKVGFALPHQGPIATDPENLRMVATEAEKMGLRLALDQRAAARAGQRQAPLPGQRRRLDRAGRMADWPGGAPAFRLSLTSKAAEPRSSSAEIATLAADVATLPAELSILDSIREAPGIGVDGDDLFAVGTVNG